MIAFQLPVDLTERRVLWAYYEVWKDAAGEEKQVCYRWVRNRFERRFGDVFHQSLMKRLAKLGILSEGWLTAGGRHWTLNDPERVREFLVEAEPSLGGEPGG